MTDLGFTTWVRQVVTDVEQGNRRVTAEEVLGLAVALAVPVDRLIYPPDDSPEVTLPGGAVVRPSARPPRDLRSLRELGDIEFVQPPEKGNGS